MKKYYPLPIVGGTKFGRYEKISTEETYNMMISDEALVTFPGILKLLNTPSDGTGRAIYASSQYGRAIAIVGSTVFSITKNNGVSPIGNLLTNSGDAFITENDNSQIAISDGLNIYVYNYSTNNFTTGGISIDFTPGFISFQDGYIIAANKDTNNWRLSALNNATSFPFDSQHVGEFQSDPDIVMACVVFNRQLFLFGKNLTELWYDEGLQLFPFQRNNYYVVPYGTPSANSIAHNNEIIVWLAQNKVSGFSIMYSDGGTPQQISNDGINFKLSRLTNPSNTFGSLYKIDGHLIYQLTAPDDNFTYAYDFNVQQFYTLTDEWGDYHSSHSVTRFNNRTYFVSLRDNGIYEMSTDYFTYNGAEIPRTRICPPFDAPNSFPFVVDDINVKMEQGNFSDLMKVEMSFCKDGGISYSNPFSKELRPLAKRPNLFRFFNCGQANDFRPKFRFWGKHRIIVKSALIGIRQGVQQ